MRLSPFSLGLTNSLETACGAIDRREGFLVAVDPESDGEPVPAPGLGEATPLPGWTESLSACEAALREVGDGNRGKELVTDALDRLDPAETPAARHGLARAIAGMGIMDMPMFTWSILATVWMMLFAFAALLAVGLILA
ncbi:hypothetical protein FK85_25200, partial [Halorubrum saccharovorum]